jgi:Protein of unknown function (DUF938)
MATGTTENKPFAPACERNKEPILEHLARLCAHSQSVVEIGSGTGQHAVYFAQQLPHLNWQPTDLKLNLSGIRQWVLDSQLHNLALPLELDVADPVWTLPDCDVFFSANTLHIMAWPLGQKMLQYCGQYLPVGGQLILYGPFNYHGKATSESNAQFDLWLKNRDPQSAIRDIELIVEQARKADLILIEDNDMPANNRLLRLVKSS